MSTSRAATLGCAPVNSISTGAKPTALAQRDSSEREPVSSTMTALRRPSSRTRRIAVSAPRAAHDETPSSERGRPSTRARRRASSASAGSPSTSVASTQSGTSSGRRSRTSRREASGWRSRCRLAPEQRAPAATDGRAEPRGQVLGAGAHVGRPGPVRVPSRRPSLRGILASQENPAASAYPSSSSSGLTRVGVAGVIRCRRRRPAGWGAGPRAEERLVERQRLDRAEVVRPRPREVRGLHPVSQIGGAPPGRRGAAAPRPGRVRRRAARAGR